MDADTGFVVGLAVLLRMEGIQNFRKSQDGKQATHRVTNWAGGAGLRKNGTRLRQSCSACQWMRATRASVIKG
jgi:hypothetical protein